MTTADQKTSFPPRQHLRRYLELRGEKAKPFAVKAGIAPSTLSNFFNPNAQGLPRTLTLKVIEKIAAVHGDPVGIVTGDLPDPLENDAENLTNHSRRTILSADPDNLDDETMQNLQLMVRRLTEIKQAVEKSNDGIESLISAISKQTETISVLVDSIETGGQAVKKSARSNRS